jgi:hypothetical protein
VVKAEAKRLKAPFEEMWLEQMYEDDECLSVTYYPYEDDMSFEVYWNVKENRIEESRYEDNGNG